MAINNVTLEGFLFKDTSEEKLITTSNGKTMLTFAFKLAKSNKDDNTPFVNVVCFGKTAEYIYKYGTKGSRIFVSGSIQGRNNQEGKFVRLEVLAERLSIITKQVVDTDTVPHIEEKFEEAPAFNEEDLPF